MAFINVKQITLYFISILRWEKFTILIIFVDGIIVTSDDYEEIATLKRKLAEEFEIKELWALKYFLQMEFARSEKGIFVNQRQYILDLLWETGLLVCKAAKNLIVANLKFSLTNDEDVIDREKFSTSIAHNFFNMTEASISKWIDILSKGNLKIS